MRYFKFIAVLALFSISVLTGCLPSTSNVAPSYGMTATIGSASFNAPATTTLAAYTAGSLALAISGSATSGSTTSQINLSIPNWTGATGTFTMVAMTGGTFSGPFGEYTPVEGGITALSQSGSITISSVSTSAIIGSFSFTCVDGTVVSAGNFVAKRY